MAGSRALPDMPALTALRGVAALLVFLYHFPVRGLGRIPDLVQREGHVGVTVFFVLSGFLITARYYPDLERGTLRLGDYFVRRVARIVPLYFVVLTLTHVLSAGRVPLDRTRIPEWTLTQGLFDPTPESLTVPTSWSLTVEECYYATAPVLFIVILAARRRLGRFAGAVLALLGIAVAVHLAGSALVAGAARAGLGHLRFLADEHLLRSYTIFGRFAEFALGGAAGLLFLSGRVEAVWRRPRGPLFGTALTLCGGALLFVGLAGMAGDGGDADAVWRWNLVVAAASSVVVLGLTCPSALPTRTLSIAPAVYLGRLSYALYLIQLTPLGKGLLFPILPANDLLHVVLLYAGMTAVSALLFELVEEPVRRTILDLRRGRPLAARPIASSRSGAAVAILGGALFAQYGTWAAATLPPVDEARATRVLGPGSRHVLHATVSADPLAREPRVRLPEAWQIGPTSDPRAPLALIVFADGARIPFLGVQDPTSAAPAAYYRRARAGHLSLQLDGEARVTIVNRTPAVAAALAWSRLRERPLLAAFPLAMAAALVFLAKRRALAWTPRASLALAVALTTLWLVLGLHRQPWAPLVAVAEIAVIAFASRSRPK